MRKQWKPNKKTVDLHPPARPSRIRRDPVRTAETQQLLRNAWWESREWEIRLALIGILVFALAISAAVIDIGHILGR